MLRKQLEHDVAVVTGAASGIGREIALLFAREGAKVACLDINEEGLKKTVQTIEAEGGIGMALPLDLTDSSQIAQAMKKTYDTWNAITILINCAAILNFDKIEDTSDESFMKILEVNIGGYFYCLREAYPYLKLSGNAKVVQFSSSTALSGTGYANMAYTASKAAALGMSKHAAGVWGKDGIRVNTICPGLTETPITDAGDGKVKGKEGREKLIPLGRIAQPDDMAHVALFLASDESKYMTGVTLHVNGGKYMYNV